AAEVAASAPPESRESARALVADPPAPPPADTGSPDGAPKRASPFVRSLAKKYGINLGQVSGSGLGGRVTKDDILGFIEQRGAQPVAEPAPAPVAVAAATGAPV